MPHFSGHHRPNPRSFLFVIFTCLLLLFACALFLVLDSLFLHHTLVELKLKLALWKCRTYSNLFMSWLANECFHIRRPHILREREIWLQSCWNFLSRKPLSWGPTWTHANRGWGLGMASKGFDMDWRWTKYYCDHTIITIYLRALWVYLGLCWFCNI